MHRGMGPGVSELLGSSRLQVLFHMWLICRVEVGEVGRHLGSNGK
jgi:hypothetical protein